MRRKRRRAAWPRRLATLFVTGVALCLGAAAWAQAPADDEEEQPRPPSIFDFAYKVEDPRDLHPPARQFQNRWRRIWGALGMRYHLYPSQATGPDDWPPHLYSGGMNYSIWRNPVTGWPEF